MTLSSTATVRVLHSLGHLPKKALGQNFLIDGNIVLKSIRLAQLEPDETVVEIGPGIGTLSQGLLQQGVTLYAVEKDPKLYGYLRAELQPDLKFFLMQGDAMDAPLAGLPEAISPFKIVANLPYAISTPWLEKILRGRLPRTMVLMLQKETAERFVSSPGTKAYSPISILLEGAYRKEALQGVSRQCFYPVPKVDSALLCLRKKEKPFIFSEKAYRLLRSFFTQRRKQIQNLCRQHKEPYPGLPLWLEEIAALGHSPLSRPEDLSFAAWTLLDLFLDCKPPDAMDSKV